MVNDAVLARGKQYGILADLELIWGCYSKVKYWGYLK